MQRDLLTIPGDCHVDVMANDESERADRNFSFTIQLHMSYISISMMLLADLGPSVNGFEL